MSLNWKRISAISRKEVFHILRDPFTMAMALGLPILLVSIFGLAIEFNMKQIEISVHDGDKSAASRALTRAFSSSGYFSLIHAERLPEALSILDHEQAKAALLIGPGFERDLGSGKTASAQILIDGADNSTVGVILGYMSGVQNQFLRNTLTQGANQNYQLRTRYLFNPELNSQWFTVPGLIVVVVAILSIMLTALTISREWENGSMELLLSTPVHPLEIVVGKLFPYTVLGLGAVLFVYLIARVGFGVPFEGSHLFYLLSVFLFISAYLAQGLLISVITRSQQLSMQLALISGLLPSILLSGFIFPIENMPTFFHFMTSIFPAKWFMIISRSLFLRGSEPWELLKPLAGLIVLNVVLMTVATKRFKKDVEP